MTYYVTLRGAAPGVMARVDPTTSLDQAHAVACAQRERAEVANLHQEITAPDGVRLHAWRRNADGVWETA